MHLSVQLANVHHFVSFPDDFVDFGAEGLPYAKHQRGVLLFRIRSINSDPHEEVLQIPLPDLLHQIQTGVQGSRVRDLP